MKPKFITFTGPDERTSLSGMAALARQYPIEWGILFSPARQGEQNRYPKLKVVDGFLDALDVGHVSAHLCGGLSRHLLATGSTPMDSVIMDSFDRVQVNTADPAVNPNAIAAWADALGVQPILQCRGEFPARKEHNLVWLFDASGGKGIAPAKWPTPPDNSFYGFAGGLNPDNVATAVAAIGAVTQGPYYIDMESGVRDADDWLSLAKCRAVCEAVYGK